MSAETTDRYLVCANIEVLEHFALDGILAPLWLTETAHMDASDACHAAYAAARRYIEDAGHEAVSVHEYERYRGGDLSCSKWIDGPEDDLCWDAMAAGVRACKEHVTQELQTPVAWKPGDLDSVVLLNCPVLPQQLFAEAQELLEAEVVVLSTVAGWHLKKALEGGAE